MTAIKHPALRFFGGKFQIGPWIISHFPEHITYCEPFAGGASVLLRKKPSKIEVYNDKNEMIVTFFKVLRERPKELIQALSLTPYSRQEYIRSQQPSNNELEQARRFYVWCWQGRGRGGVVEAGGWRFMKTNSRGKTPCDDWQRLDHLYTIAQRLRKVQIECVDALRCIDLYDTPDTLFYIDPPYVHETRSIRWGRSSYVHEYSDENQIQLAEKLQTIQGMAIVSGYPSDLYDKLYSGWKTRSKISGKDTSEPSRVKTREMLWISPKITLIQTRMEI